MTELLRRKQKFLLIALFIISFLAFVDSIILSYIHFSNGSSGLCNFGEGLNCDSVSQSPYATVDGIFYFLAVDLGIAVPVITIGVPVAVTGILLFLLVKAGLIHIWHNKHFHIWSPHHILKTIRYVLGFSLAYGLWLIYIQKFVLKTYCFYCLILDFLILSAFLISLRISIDDLHGIHTKKTKRRN